MTTNTNHGDLRLLELAVRRLAFSPPSPSLPHALTKTSSKYQEHPWRLDAVCIWYLRTFIQPGVPASTEVPVFPAVGVWTLPEQRSQVQPCSSLSQSLPAIGPWVPANQSEASLL